MVKQTLFSLFLLVLFVIGRQKNMLHIVFLWEELMHRDPIRLLHFEHWSVKIFTAFCSRRHSAWFYYSNSTISVTTWPPQTKSQSFKNVCYHLPCQNMWCFLLIYISVHLVVLLPGTTTHITWFAASQACNRGRQWLPWSANILKICSI